MISMRQSARRRCAIVAVVVWFVAGAGRGDGREPCAPRARVQSVPVAVAPQVAGVGTVNGKTESGLVVVPFAVPVAVPVAVVTAPTFFYAYSIYADTAPHEGAYRTPRNRRAMTRREPPCDEPAPEPEGEEAGPRAERTPKEPRSAVARACASCHGASRPAGGLAIEDPSALTTQQRLEAIARVVSDDPTRRMPKGAALSPSEIGAVLQELARPSDDK